MGKLIYAIRWLFHALRNLFRRARRAPEYLLFVIEESYPELPVPLENWWQRLFAKSPLSLQELGEQFRIVAGDSRVKGVILHLRPLHMSMAQLQTLRDFIKELKAAGKRVIAWSYSYQQENYYVACAADQIIMMEGGSISPLGFKMSFYFLAESLERAGIKLDAIQITPYKTAPDIFMRKDMSDESRAMANWLVDSYYAQFIRAVAEGRKIGESQARDLIDKTPYVDTKAKELLVVDALLSEEELPAYLGSKERPARITPWEEAKRSLKLRPLKRPGRYVALLRIEGDIVDGRSQRPPIRPPLLIPFLTKERAGDLSVVQEARRVLRDRRAAALVVYVDSGGGSATASEAMSAALRQVAAVKPVVVCMGSVAGSGGYYISTPGQWIIAQPATITGSIGVVTGKIVNAGLLDKLHFHKENISRGKNATMQDAGHFYTEEERKLIFESIQRTYELFLERVCKSRKMTRDAVDSIGGGRVWTGLQACENGLVDEVGGLQRAFAKARELASLDERTPVRQILPQKETLPPLPQPTAMLNYAIAGLKYFNRAKVLLISSIYPDYE